MAVAPQQTREIAELRALAHALLKRIAKLEQVLGGTEARLVKNDAEPGPEAFAELERRARRKGYANAREWLAAGRELRAQKRAEKKLRG